MSAGVEVFDRILQNLPYVTIPAHSKYRRERVITTYGYTQPEFLPSSLTLATRFAKRYQEKWMMLDGFACVKAAANHYFLNPTVGMSGDNVTVLVERQDAARLTGLRKQIAGLIPGAIFCEVTVGTRVRLEVALPLKPLTEQEIFNVLDYILTHVAPKEIRRILYFFGYTVESFLEALAARQDVSSVLTSLFDALIVDDNVSRPLKQDFSSQVQASFVFAVQTRRDSKFYETVAEVFTHYYEE